MRTALIWQTVAAVGMLLLGLLMAPNPQVWWWLRSRLPWIKRWPFYRYDPHSFPGSLGLTLRTRLLGLFLIVLALLALNSVRRGEDPTDHSGIPWQQP